MADADIPDITALLKRERFHRDTAQWDLCRAAFHPDAEETYIDVSWFQGNIDAFLARSSAVHPGKVNVIHSSFDPVDIKVSGDRATSSAFCVITSSITLAGVEYELASYMRLLHRLRKVSGLDSWRIVRLEAIYVRDRLVCAFPGLDASRLAMPGEILVYPRPYRCMAFVMLNRGLKPRVDLPNEEDQESVRRVLNANVAFLIDR
ncbi:uncharacterized protein APUU_10635S [Aspergillus puulaauensis]|uniref:SnoaL-like domain-containing protein n=1 Tax=Aspergillus puulaauensis TaxID=1220207 RepID=A0A7R7XAG5_9EURO|nr:uncharacterized protein APUU_10635S [Aspergillus puulaauensis]BCS17807.1 hypothetical protein APUU_10635S [Aspergillus puulaauensis]